MVLLSHMNNKFFKLLTKKKEKRFEQSKQLMELQWTELFTIPGFKALVDAHDEVNSHDYMLTYNVRYLALLTRTFFPQG